MQKREQGRLARIYRQSRLKSPYAQWHPAKRLWIYQKERIPVVLLFLVGLILYAAVAYVTHHTYNWIIILLATSLSTLYLVQVRLMDEPKDYEHDIEYHAGRPVQRGLVTLAELRTVKRCVIGLFLLLSLSSGSIAIIILAIIQQCYAYCTQKEFFIRDWLRQHFLIYQLSHYTQLLLLGWLTTTALQIDGFTEQFIMFGYVVAMSFPVELSRTIGSKDDRAANDRYSHKLGSTAALMLFIISVGVVVAYTIAITFHSGGTLNPLPLAISLLVVAYTALSYEHSPTAKNANILNFSSALVYIGSASTLLMS